MPNDEEEAAVQWCKFVDGVNIFPKLPVHMRSYGERYERNQRVKDSVRNAKSGSDKLTELNATVVPSPSEIPNVAQQEAVPAQSFLPLTAQAQTVDPYVVTARTSIGDVPCDGRRDDCRIGKRGRDAKPRTGRTCSVCTKKDSCKAASCPGRGGKRRCLYFCSCCVEMGDPNAASCPGRADLAPCPNYCFVCISKKKMYAASTCPGRSSAALCPHST